MVKFILGSAGTGKTTIAHNILANLCKKGDNKLLMLVPDQSSFETENTFLNLLGPKLCRNILVFGFSRMSNYVFSQTGNLPDNVIDDGVRSIIMSIALDEVEDNLEMYSKNNNRRSVLDLMIHSLKECKKDNISTDMLRDVAGVIDDSTLCSKLQETALVLDSYDAIMSRSYIDPLDNLNRLKNILISNNIFKDYTIVVDSFSGFTYQQLEIIELLMRDAKDFYVTLNLDYSKRDSELYFTTNRTYKLLKQIARKNDLKVENKTVLDKHYRFVNSELEYLENNMFCPTKVTYTDKADNIEAYISKDIYDEADFVARRIKKLVVEEGYFYKDIAVVSRSEEDYIGVLDTTLEKYNIPYFMDIPKDIYTRPVVRLVSSIIDAVTSSFNREQILNIAKTGLLQLTDTEIAQFENYLFVWDIDGKALKNNFTNNPSGFEKMTDSQTKQLEKIEKTRQYIIGPLEKFQRSCSDANGLEISKALYCLLEDYNIADSINNMFNTDDELLLCEAQEEVRVYNSLMDAIEKLVAVIGERNITLKKYKEYFDLKLADMTLSEIPRFQEQITVGTADRVRLNNPKAVFIIGAIDEKFPSIPKTAGVFTETERRLLISNNLPLTDSLEDLNCHEKYLAYCALTSCCERLFVSTYTTDYAGNSYKPSVIFTEILRLFPNCILSDYADYNQFNELWSKENAFECLAKNYSEQSGQVTALKEYFSNLELYNGSLENIEKTLNKKPFKISNKENAEKLFGKDIHISASQLERYEQCAFRYFCTYGLNVKERRKASIDGSQFGSVVHYFLEKFLKENNKEVLNNLTDEQIKSSIDSILLDYADEVFGGIEGKSNSFISLFERLKRNLFTLTKQIIRQLQFSDFIPVDFELKIGSDSTIPEYKINIDKEHSVSVRGFIDRVDVLPKSDDEIYVRVVDYKTNNKTFTLSQILYGINMQMLIYLRAIAEKGDKYYGKKIIPAGVLYMPSLTTDVKAEDIVKEDDIVKILDKNFIMDGLVLNDDEVLAHMDKQGKMIKLGRMKNGEFSNNVATTEQFNCIFNHIDNTIKEMGKALLEGDVSVDPIKGAVDGCSYCPYDSVCCFKYGDKYRFKENLNPQEVYEEMGKEENK